MSHTIVFRAAGADNVAWVWAPADPLHDQQFAPPPSSINVVLQDFINYPGTRWRDPEKVLRSLALRYPGKPLFVEVSVSGAATQKAAWLASLGQAVDDCPQVLRPPLPPRRTGTQSDRSTGEELVIGIRS